MYLVLRKYKLSSRYTRIEHIEETDKLICEVHTIMREFDKGGENGYYELMARLNIPRDAFKAVRAIVDHEYHCRFLQSEAAKYLAYNQI
jgi:hypothetical protein